MKKLELNQMENLEGGSLKRNVNIACGVIAAASIASGIFTFGASTVAGLTYASAFCLGWGIPQM